MKGSPNSLTERKRGALLSELAIVGFAGLCLVAAELMLSFAIRGTNFDGADGKMARAIILAAQRFGGFLQFNNINPIQGLGSQLLPINVWINPTYWPFAILGETQAADASAAITLGIFAIASYVMARCFDVPIIPSAIAAQLTIVLFAPMLFVLQLSTVFSLMVGHAVVNAPYMVALGLLARLEPGSWRSFGVITASIFALLIYSLCCDSLWSIVCCSSWALPFAMVAFSPMLSAAAERPVVAPASQLRGAEPVPVVPGLRCGRLLGGVSNDERVPSEKATRYIRAPSPSLVRSRKTRSNACCRRRSTGRSAGLRLYATSSSCRSVQ
jgi:hypothetical protein